MISPTQSNLQAALRSFLLAALPTGISVISGQQNRASEPNAGDFVVMTPIRFERLETNLDCWADVKFIGAISGTTLTVTEMAFGSIAAGATLFGVGVAGGTTIVGQIDGTPGGVGTYTVSVDQTVASEVLSCGAQTLTQGALATVQLDFHSAALDAGDLAQTISTLLRDEYAVDFFAALEPPLNAVVPLYADDPKQMPFVNAEAQYEWRWVLEAKFQVDQTVSVPQRYADAATVTPISVDAAFPPV